MRNGSDSIREVIDLCIQEKSFIRINRDPDIDPGSVSGRLECLVGDWIVVSSLDEGINLDGFTCLRISDIQSIEYPHPYIDFLRSVFRARQLEFPPFECVGEDIRRMILEVRKAYTLITLHCEVKEPELCHIGIVEEIRLDGQIDLREIGPDAIYDEVLTHLGIGDVTKMQFGTKYEEALKLASSILDPSMHNE